MSNDARQSLRVEQAQWKVGPHGAIEKLEHNLWRVEGDVPGGKLKRVMAIAKLPDDDLVVHNAIALDEPRMREIDEWGRVAYIVVPNGYHRLDCGRFKRRYPSAKVVCPAAAIKRVNEVAKVDVSYADFSFYGRRYLEAPCRHQGKRGNHGGETRRVEHYRVQ